LITAAHNFTHQIAEDKRPEHKLVTEGIYQYAPARPPRADHPCPSSRALDSCSVAVAARLSSEAQRLTLMMMMIVVVVRGQVREAPGLLWLVLVVGHDPGRSLQPNLHCGTPACPSLSPLLSSPLLFSSHLLSAALDLVVDSSLCGLRVVVSCQGFAVASWKFFSDRIEYEEATLVEFFGDAYRAYKTKTPTGIPMIA
jgi:hypothetical protein